MTNLINKPVHNSPVLPLVVLVIIALVAGVAAYWLARQKNAPKIDTSERLFRLSPEWESREAERDAKARRKDDFHKHMARHKVDAPVRRLQVLIDKALASGHPAQEILDHLIEQGWHQSTIKKAMGDTYPQQKRGKVLGLF